MRLEHLLMKTRDANSGGINAMSTGEALAAALVLNRPDWLASMGYTIAQALDRVDADTIALIPVAARMVANANDVIAQAQAAARDEVAMEDLGGGAEEVDVNAKLITYGNAPGYRDVTLIFDLQRFESTKTHRVRMHVNTEDGLTILRHIIDVNRVAWDGQNPIDGKGEVRPRWLDRLYPPSPAE
jgi:hypothetical protein